MQSETQAASPPTLHLFRTAGPPARNAKTAARLWRSGTAFYAPSAHTFITIHDAKRLGASHVTIFCLDGKALTIKL